MGYVGMVDFVMADNPAYQRLATEELGRRRLGPFAADGSAPASAGEPVAHDEALARLAEVHAAERRARAPGALARGWQALPAALRGLALAGALVTASALGVQWETGASELGLAARLALHAWILGAIVLAFVGARRIREAHDNESLAFGAALAVLLAIGALTERFLERL